jgi:hypothetical protein
MQNVMFSARQVLTARAGLLVPALSTAAVSWSRAHLATLLISVFVPSDIEVNAVSNPGAYLTASHCLLVISSKGVLHECSICDFN